MSEHDSVSKQAQSFVSRPVEIVEVGARDGLQNEAAITTPEQRADLVERLVAAGLRRLEVVSFVNPARVPQMAGAEELMRLVPRVSGVRYAGLVLNERGLDRAVDAGVDEVDVVVVCSDTFGRRNQGQGREEMADLAGRLVQRARSQGILATVTLAAAFGCPFEGEVPPDQVLATAKTVLDADVNELALADTIGCGVPEQVRTLVARIDALGYSVPLRFHFHNTRNTGYANAMAAIDAGVTRLDASIGGLGGCPFAPRATGNIATEDLAWQLERSGRLEPGVHVEALVGITEWAGPALDVRPPGLVARAGIFPGSLGTVAS